MKLKSIIVILLIVIIYILLSKKTNISYYNLEKFSDENSEIPSITSVNIIDKISNKDISGNYDTSVDYEDVSKNKDEDGISSGTPPLIDVINEEKNKNYKEIKSKVKGKISEEKEEMPNFISSIEGYSKYTIDKESYRNNNQLYIEPFNSSNINALLSKADNIYSPHKKNVLMKDAKNDKITSQCYKISASYGLNKSNNTNNEDINSKDSDKAYILCRPECLKNKMSSNININMSDSVSDDFDFWCKNEFGREYGLKYINKKDCSTGMGRAVCSKNFYNGYPI